MKDFIKQAAHVKPDANQLRLNDNDVKRLNELGELIKNSFRTNLAEGKEITIEPYNGSETQRVITIELGERMKLNFLELSENIAEGQRVENFIVQHRNEDKIWFNSFEGTTIGTKKIMKLHGLNRRCTHTDSLVPRHARNQQNSSVLRNDLRRTLTHRRSVYLKFYFSAGLPPLRQGILSHRHAAEVSTPGNAE